MKQKHHDPRTSCPSSMQAMTREQNRHCGALILYFHLFVANKALYTEELIHREVSITALFYTDSKCMGNFHTHPFLVCPVRFR